MFDSFVGFGTEWEGMRLLHSTYAVEGKARNIGGLSGFEQLQPFVFAYTKQREIFFA